MVYTILTISSFVICCVALGINCFALRRQIRLNKDLIKEIELRAKYEKYLISRYEEVYEEKRKLEWQNERLREQVEFFERELSTEEGVKNAECRVQNAE
ncbi:MAG: hypothetical protein UIG59_02320 [Acutalibacteraceae bacterium]|nr:hypothetical protein [Acutalibacteraceae bacterium]